MANMFLEARDVAHAPPFVKGRCARDALPHTFNIGVFKCDKNNSTTMENIYN